MSTELKIIDGPHMLQLTQYFGGEKGVCLQITGRNGDDVGYIGIGVREAYELIKELTKWIQSVSEEKAEMLSDAIAKYKEMERSIINDAVACTRSMGCRSSHVV